MEISKERFVSAAAKLGIPKNQVDALWALLENRDENSKASAFSKLIFYFGALIIISAMTWLLGVSWERFGGAGIFLISVSYAIAFTLLGARLWRREDLKIPAGLLITCAVCMTPLAIYGVEVYLKIWPQNNPGVYKDFYHMVKDSWIFMELGTMAAGVIALRFFAFPFITAPIFLAAWFFTMDIVPILIGSDPLWEERGWISMGFGIVLTLIAYLIDLRKMREYAFWGYLFGILAFWIGLNAQILNKGEFIFFIYLIVNLLMMVLAILLKRTVFMVFGVMGAFIYFGHLAYGIFKDSILFPFVLSAIGLLIIFLGVQYQKKSKWIENKVMGIIPLWIRNLLPPNQ